MTLKHQAAPWVPVLSLLPASLLPQTTEESFISLNAIFAEVKQPLSSRNVSNAVCADQHPRGGTSWPQACANWRVAAFSHPWHLKCVKIQCCEPWVAISLTWSPCHVEAVTGCPLLGSSPPDTLSPPLFLCSPTTHLCYCLPTIPRCNCSGLLSVLDQWTSPGSTPNKASFKLNLIFVDFLVLNLNSNLKITRTINKSQ